jgi:hypothetical protein
MRKIKIGRMVQEGKVGEVFPHRNHQSLPIVEAARRGPIRAARWRCWNEDRGETERRLRPTYRRGLATDWAGIDGNWRGGDHGVSGMISAGARRRCRCWRVGPCYQWEEEEKEIPFWVCLIGPWANSGSGPIGSRGPFTCFFCSVIFSFSDFLIYS